MRSSLVLALTLLCLTLGYGCTVRNPAPNPLPDAGADAGPRDSGLVRDVGPTIDGGTDGGVVADAGASDAASADAATNDAAVVLDAGSDAGADGGRDGGSDAGSDGGSDAGRDAAVVLPGVLNETGTGAEADYCVLQFPATTTVVHGAASVMIFGQIYEIGRTDTTVGSAAPGISAELGYGPAGTDPRTSTAWAFHAASFNVETGTSNNNDEYMSTLTIPAAGTYAYTFRFSFDGGANVTYCDLDGAGSSGTFAFSPAQLGAITVM